MSSPSFTQTGKLWIWASDTGPASWHFISITGDIAEEIQAHAAMARLELGMAKKRGWGAIKVEAQIRESVWRTSIFPNKGDGGYLLPVKAAIRKAENIIAGDEITVRLTLV